MRYRSETPFDNIESALEYVNHLLEATREARDQIEMEILAGHGVFKIDSFLYCKVLHETFHWPFLRGSTSPQVAAFQFSRIDFCSGDN